jgi:TolB-like protein/Flp pilus assembly protein TadD
MSGDKEQEYFSDGLSEELLDDLSRINELQVAARTSAFSFKGKDTDIGTIARKLNVGAVLEGSVRRSGNTVRITAHLNNAATGFHLWSQTYDRNVGDMLQLQTEIATAVANALKVTLLGDVSAKIELGGTHDPAAFDAYLRGVKTAISSRSGKDVEAAIAAYTDAIRLDANYALAFARRSKAFMFYGDNIATRVEDRNGSFHEGYADARRAIALAPDLAEGHLALGRFFEVGALNFARANEEYERALALAPGDARVLRETSLFAVEMGSRTDTSVAAARRAVTLDPLNKQAYYMLGMVLFYTRQYEKSVDAFQHSLALDPDDPSASALLGFAYYNRGKFQSARESCETKPDDWEDQECLALTYEKLGRHADAEAMLAKLKAAHGGSSAYNYAEITAQWGNSDEALGWLKTALRLRDSGLAEMKVNPFLDPLRKEPRFQAIERELKFPSD